MATYTLQQYNTLTAAIAQGALKVKYADKEVDYRSLDEMLRIAAIMAADLGITTSGTGRVIQSRFKSGLNNKSNLPDNNQWN